MDCMIPFHFRQVTNIADIVDTKNAEKGTILDISGGGLKFVSKYVLMEAMLIKGLIEMDGEPALIAGKILHARQITNDGIFQYRLRFEGLPDEVSQMIIQYVLRLQRNQLQREQNLSFFK